MAQPGLTHIPLSPSVQNAAQRFDREEPIRSWALVQALLQNHPEYANRLGGKLMREDGPAQAEQRPLNEWLEQLDHLFDPAKVPEIHGRLAILGLTRLDPALEAYLSSTGAVAALQQELKENFNPLLKQEDTSNRGDSGPPPGTETVSVAGYISDTVHGEATDRLDIEREVSNIAYVLTSKRVRPPLSLGLFGDWGSGKSFFMKKLQKCVETIAKHYREKEEETGQASEWCSRVVQIEFNAWHFSDANLWASLVTRIYEALHHELSGERPSDKVLRDLLEEEVARAEGVVRQAQVQFDEARASVGVATGALQKAQGELRTQEAKLNELIGDIGILLEDDDATREQLHRAAEALGYPEAARTYAALEELDADLRSFSSRLSAVTLSLFRSPTTLVFLALLVIALPVTVAFLLEQYAEEFSEFGKRLAEVSTFLFGIIAWLRMQVGRGLRWMETVETGMQRARHARERRIQENEVVRQAHQRLLLAQSEEQAARHNLQHAQEELQRLQSQLRELRPERKLFRLIEERGEAATYTKHLGIVSLIRADFEKMSGLLSELAAEQRDLSVEPPPIQRIILYIDDLDRCRPERVVEVLEAVHLLLAFPLFIVVVGVDPRWLRHSLAQHYPHTLYENGAAGALRHPAAPFSTPQDYLEKIFQLPFTLRPVEKNGYQGLVADLLQPLPEPARRSPAPGSGDGHLDSGGPPPPGDGGTEAAADERMTPASHSEDGQRAGAPAAPEHQTFIPINPEQLEFTSQEKQDIDRLWRMFRTPRTVKRFINTYRLLRAGLADPKEIARFEGTPEEPGEYQVALLLLAITTSAPNEADIFLHQLGALLEQLSPEEEKAEPLYWRDVLGALRDPLIQADPDWIAILEDLEDITRDGFGRSFTRKVLRRWAWRVARYSFSVHPAQALS